MPDTDTSWYVYILECADNSLYTGVTTDLEKRLHAHNNLPSGARYTRGRRPVSLVYAECLPDRGTAQSREAAIKKMKKARKRALIESYPAEA